jgi:hypothetical protein
MGNYPINISEEENSKLKYPFLPNDRYESVHHLPDGPTILIRSSEEKLTKADIARMVEINCQIAARRILNKQKDA